MRLAAAAVLAATLLAAQPAGAAGEKPSRKQQLAVQLARLALPEGNYAELMANVRAQLEASIEQGMKASGQPVPERLVKILREELGGIVDGAMFSYQEMVDLQAGLLVKHYSEAELDQLVAFYKTPVGQKSIQVMPAVMQDAMAAGQARAQQQLPEKLQALQRRIEAELAAMKAEGAGGAPEAQAAPPAAK